MTGPTTIDFAATPGVSHDPGVFDREAQIDGTRSALVEYSTGAGRRESCDTPHAGYVVSGTITYVFEDGREPVVVGPGGAFVLPAAPRHPGANQGSETARLFLIDALPGP